MKKTTFLKSLLLAAALTTGASAWAVTNSTTVTGIVGATDNSSGFDVVGNKQMPLAAGDEYVITFVNYNKGANGTDYWENWAFISNVFACRADHGDSNPYWGSAKNVSYTGNSWTDISSTITDWLRAYNGVTVTLTVSRDAAGTGISVTHSAKTNAVGDIPNQTYAGTFTATVAADAAINFYLTVEDAHLNITNVVYTNASNEVTHYDLVNVDLSQFAGDYCTYSEGVETFSVSSATQKWCTLDLSSYYTNISGTITNVNMTLTENIEGVVENVTKTNRFGIGIYGDTKTFNKPSNVDTGNSITWWGITGNSAANRIYYNSSSYVSGLIFNTDAKVAILMDMTYKKFSFIQDGTTKVNYQNFNDNTITQAKYLAVQTWSTPVAASIKDVTLEIVYLDAAYYTATFTNTTSGNTPGITIYTDENRTNTIANGLLEDGKTYYFTATETGYQDYNGSFTVSGSDPAVSFAMTAKAVYNYTVNAVDAENGIIKSAIVSGTCYANESTSFYLPTCVLVDGKLYFMAAEQSYKSETVTENNQVFSYQYTASTVDNVVFFVEGESINGAAKSTPTNLQNLASNGYMGRGSNLGVTTLPAGAYTIYVKYINANSSAQSFVVKAGDTDVINETGVTGRPTKSGTVTLTEETAITLTATASSISGVDYLYIVKTADVDVVSFTLGTNDESYKSFVTKGNTDFTALEGVTAYIAKAADKANNTVTLSSIDNAPAETPVLLCATKGATATITTTTESYEAPSVNYLKAADGETAIGPSDEKYVLAYVDNVWEFRHYNGTLSAGKVYLDLSILGVRAASLRFVFDGEATGIDAVKGEQSAADGYYNLQGQRISQPQKGLYIVNGKKVVVK